jgi:hypothetical protein
MKLYFILVSLAPCHPFFLDRSIRHDVVEQRLFTYFTLGPVAQCNECLFNDLILPPGDYATKSVGYFTMGNLVVNAEKWKNARAYSWQTNNYRFDVYCTPDGEVLGTMMMDGLPRPQPRAKPPLYQRLIDSLRMK